MAVGSQESTVDPPETTVDPPKTTVNVRESVDTEGNAAVSLYILLFIL